MDEIGAKERLVFSGQMLLILLHLLLDYMRQRPDFDRAVHLVSREKVDVVRFGCSIRTPQVAITLADGCHA